MSQQLIEKIRAARAVRIEYKHMVLFATRPSLEDYAQLARDKAPDSVIAIKHITGWEGVRECDLLPHVSISTDLVKYDAALFAEAAPDLPFLIGAIARDLTTAVIRALGDAEAASKNSVAGSTQSLSNDASPASSQSH